MPFPTCSLDVSNLRGKGKRQPLVWQKTLPPSMRNILAKLSLDGINGAGPSMGGCSPTSKLALDRIAIIDACKIDAEGGRQRSDDAVTAPVCPSQRGHVAGLYADGL
jgi:hypothetical protein